MVTPQDVEGGEGVNAYDILHIEMFNMVLNCLDISKHYISNIELKHTHSHMHSTSGSVIFLGEG